MGGGNNGKGVTGNVLLGTVPPIFSMVGTPGNIVDNNAIDGKIGGVGTGITGSRFVTKGLVKDMIPSGRILGSSGRTLWDRFEWGTGYMGLISMSVIGISFKVEIGCDVEETAPETKC